MKIGAKSVLVALPKTAAYPKAAASITGNPIKPAKITPKDAPMENNGVTSPPWNPKERVNTVSRIFNIQSYA